MSGKTTKKNTYILQQNNTVLYSKKIINYSNKIKNVDVKTNNKKNTYILQQNNITKQHHNTYKVSYFSPFFNNLICSNDSGLYN